MATLLELKDWLENGGKIKRSGWINRLYYKHGVFYNDQGNAIDLGANEVFATDWEMVVDNARWKPARGDIYYLVSYDEVYSCTWDDEDCDRKVFRGYNCFKTKGEAEHARDLWLAERELRSLADGGDFVIKYEDDRGFYVDKYFLVATPYRFPTEYAAKEAIKQLGEEKLKLIFGVK